MSFQQLHLHQYLAQAGDSQQAQVRLWVPGEQVVTHQVQMPAAARRKWPDMVPWLLEDQLLESPEQMHFSLGRADAEHRVAVLSVPRARMLEWQSLCASVSGRVVAMLPDYLALPWEAGGLSLLIEGERWIVRCGALEGYAGSADFVATLLARQLADNPDAQLSYIGREQNLPDFCQGRSRHLADHLDWAFCDYPQELNLLRGDYRPGSFWTGLQSWWPSLAAVSLCLVLGLGYLAGNYVRLSGEIPRLQTELATAYRALLGGNLPAGNVRVATQAQIDFRESQYLASQAVPLAVLSQLDGVLSNCTGCELHSVEGDGTRVELRLTADEALEGRFRALRDLNVSVARNAEGELLVTAEPMGVTNG